MAAGSGEALAEWRLADTAHDRFGEVLSDDAVHCVGVARGHLALTNLEGETVLAERVLASVAGAWVLSRTVGPRRDLRLFPARRDSAGRRAGLLADALNDLRFDDKTKRSDWPHRGPSALLEVSR